MEDLTWTIAWIVMAALVLAVLIGLVHFLLTGDLTFASHGVCR